MSGVIGIYCLDDRPVERPDLEAMLKTLAHRGPDGADLWSKGCVGLGHHMLWTTPESLFEQLPLVNPAGHLVLTADARIDNREELYTALKINDRPLEKIADSELILAAYEQWGQDCADRLLGDFAFAIWDSQQQYLFCARDPLGVKPFYYYHSDRLFAFASEVKGIFTLSTVPQRINEVRIGDYLTANLSDPAITTYEGVWRLPGGHTLCVNQSGLQVQRYWHPDPNHILHLDSDAAYAEQFRKLFTEAVRCRLRSAFPVGSQLSGGLDSSSIVCTAYQLLQQTSDAHLHAFSIIYERVPESDEQPYIRSVLQGKEIPAHVWSADETGPLTHWQTYFDCLDEPVLGNGYLMWGITQRAAESGMRILLNGFDGDTVVSHGVAYLSELAHRGEWKQLVQESQALAERVQQPGFSTRYFVQTHSRGALKKLVNDRKWRELIRAMHHLYRPLEASRSTLYWTYIIRPSIPRFLIRFASKIRQTLFRSKSTSEANASTIKYPINPAFAERIRSQERWQLLNPNRPFCSEHQTHFDQVISGQFALPLEGVDLISARFQIEPRFPFTDRRLVEYCLSLPGDQKLHQGWGRWVLRQAMQDILPPDIQWRPYKITPSAGFFYGLETYDRALIQKILFNLQPRLKNYLNADVINQYYRELMSDKSLNREQLSAMWLAINVLFWTNHPRFKNLFKKTV